MKPPAGISPRPPWRSRLAWGAAVALLALPLLVSSPYYLSLLVMVFLWTTAASAWNLLGGFTGQLSLGHAAYFGVGAYAVALLGSRFGVSPWLGLLAGAAAAVPVALVIGGVCFRLRGPYFTLATIASTEVLRQVALNWRSFTNGAVGLSVPPLFVGVSRAPYYYATLALAALTLLVSARLTTSKTGYWLQAIREDEDTAQSIGVDTARYKLLALAISAVFVALAGGIFAGYLSYIEPDIVLTVGLSIQICVFAIIGGLGTVEGPVLGAFLLTIASELFRSSFKQAHLIIYGVLMIVVMLFMPDGLLGQYRRWRSRPATSPAGSKGVRA